MKATDLRIGNLVKYNGKEISISPTGLKEFFYLQDTHAESSLDQRLYEPIPLTESWLERGGFKKHEQPHLYFLNPQIRFNLNTFTITLIRSCDKAGESQRHECGYPSLTDMIPCDHVHQLQNIIFALTNQELTFNEKSSQFKIMQKPKTIKHETNRI